MSSGSRTEKTFGIITLGCSKNVVDSENLIGILEANGIKRIENVENAGYVIINTCGFINPSIKENINTIFDAVAFKRQNKEAKLIVAGCLPARYDTLAGQIPEVDLFVGVNSHEKIIEFISGESYHCNAYRRKLLTPAHYAYLKISEGCSRECSFCTIPSIRGAHISRRIEDIIDEAKYFTEQGVKEFNIIAQDTTYYGLDLYGSRKLAELLKELSDIEGIGWLRLLYAYPSGFPEDVLDVIAERPNICKYIDIPLQHINSRILKSMRRGLDRDKTEKLIERIREKVPGITLRSTFIVGYPGETEAEFRELLDFIKNTELDRVGVFPYYSEEGTPAHNLKDDISQKTKEKRIKRIMEAQQSISLRKNRELIGKTLKVIIDSFIDGRYYARIQSDAPEIDNSVIIETDKSLPIGNFMDVKIKKAEEYDLYAS